MRRSAVGSPPLTPPAKAPGRAARLAAAVLALGLVTALAAGCGPPAGGTGLPGGHPSAARSPALAAAGAPADSLPSFPDRWPLSATEPAVRAPRAMVVTTDSVATAVGLHTLRVGGNAVDAAVATFFALAVVQPQAGNLGGGGFLVARLPDGASVALDFREKAPGAATRDMYLDAEGRPTGDSWTGHLASGVPGSVAGMAEAHRRFGSLPWEELLAPAVHYAEEGFPVTRELRDDLEARRDRLTRFPSSVQALLPDGEPPRIGSILRQPALARTLRAIARDGPETFYRGWIADSLVAEMERGGGIIDHGDLAAYEAVWRRPVEVRYRNRTVISMPPPSSGAVTLGMMLRILEGYELGELSWHSPEAIHLMVEAMRRAFADRNYWLGDPDFVEIPMKRLLSSAYADSLRATIDPDRASDSDDFSRVPVEEGQTTHFSVVDPEGAAVAITTTLNGTFGSGVTVRGAGFLLNNVMDDFTVKPGFPNAYGLVQGEANAIEPGKRMLSAMTPTIVVGPDGRTEMVTGTPGGATIITTVLQAVTAHVDWGLPIQTAVNAPRFHHQHLPDRIRYERDGLRTEAVGALRLRGHEVEERTGFSGDLQSILVTPQGELRGASDPRRGGTAMGF